MTEKTRKTLKIGRADTSAPDGWIRCGSCGHKLAKILIRGRSEYPTSIEFKCHSCKALNMYIT